MIPIAVVLLVLGAALTLIVGLNSQHPVATDAAGHLDLRLFGLTIPVSEFGLFCCGAAAMLALVLAIALIRGGVRRGRAARRNRKELLRAATGKAAETAERKSPNPRVLPGRTGAAHDRTGTERPSTTGPDSASTSTSTPTSTSTSNRSATKP